MLQDLTGSWAGQRVWTLLDTCLSDGGHFVDICRLWRDDAARPPVLHYVALADTNSALNPDLLAKRIADLGLGDISQELAHLYTSFNRLLIADGSLSLTLCVGDTADSLKALRAQLDSVLLDARCARWTDLHWTQLALNCRTGAKLYATAGDLSPESDMGRYGFSGQVHTQGGMPLAQFLPRWHPKTSRRLASTTIKPQRCAVIGAGLSGAAAARALALRGWEVTVYDALPAPAGGASGLPVGLCVPLQSVDDNPLSRLSRQGVRLTLTHAKHYLRTGVDWQHTGVLEKGDAASGEADVLHTHAGWIKPAALVKAWLNHPAIRCVGDFEVTGLRRDNNHWLLQGARPDATAQADIVVFANAYGCRGLLAGLADICHPGTGVLQKLSALHPVHGTLSMGADHDTESGAINGSGSWIGKVPADKDYFWAAGATYEPEGQVFADIGERHADNLRKLRMLSEQHARTMQDALDKGELSHWSGTRCVTHDRLPLVGPLEQADQPTLWICAGMGSRGMSLATLCAELLAAYIGSEPLPLPARLAQSLSVMRPTRGTSTDTTKA